MRIVDSPRTRVVVGTSIIAAMTAFGVILSGWPSRAADDLKPDQSLRAFMRKKLDASSQILEGLTTEDAALIQQGAQALTQISKTERWQILTDSDYREFSADFRATVKKLADAAEKGNFDNAALQWFDTMKSCIECHKYVRSERAIKK